MNKRLRANFIYLYSPLNYHLFCMNGRYLTYFQNVTCQPGKFPKTPKPQIQNPAGGGGGSNPTKTVSTQEDIAGKFAFQILVNFLKRTSKKY